MSDDRFIVSMPLYTSDHAISILNKRFNLARLIYNSFLGECEKRRKNYIANKNYLEANSLYKKYKSDDTKEKSSLLKSASELYNLARKESKFYLRSSAKNEMINSLEVYASNIIQNSYLGKHIDSHCRNQLMKTAFTASEKVIIGKKTYNKKTKTYQPPRVFFKRKKDNILSLEGKNCDSPLRLDDKGENVIWSGLILPIINSKDDPKYQHAKNLIITYIRLKRKMIGNEWLYFCDIVCKGKPLLNHSLGHGTVGVDIGPSVVAYVSDSEIELRNFSDKLSNTKAYESLVSEERILQRKLDRQRRNNNPENYNPDGTIKKNSKIWKESKRQKLVQYDLNDTRRRVAETRKHFMLELIWKIRSQADIAKIDKDSYKGWQKQYGKSVGKNAPGMFARLLKEVFEKTNGKYYEINTISSKSSQRCPNCDNLHKKGSTEQVDSRSIRTHECNKCNFIIQRDIASAIVNKFWNIDEDRFDVDSSSRWIMEKRSLQQSCIKRIIQSAKEGLWTGSFGKISELERIDCELSCESISDALLYRNRQK